MLGKINALTSIRPQSYQCSSGSTFDVARYLADYRRQLRLADNDDDKEVTEATERQAPNSRFLRAIYR